MRMTISDYRDALERNNCYEKLQASLPRTKQALLTTRGLAGSVAGELADASGLTDLDMAIGLVERAIAKLKLPATEGEIATEPPPDLPDDVT